VGWLCRARQKPSGSQCGSCHCQRQAARSNPLVWQDLTPVHRFNVSAKVLILLLAKLYQMTIRQNVAKKMPVVAMNGSRPLPSRQNQSLQGVLE